MYSDLNHSQAIYYPGVPMYPDMVKPTLSDPFGYAPMPHLYDSRQRYAHNPYTTCTDSSCTPSSRQSAPFLYPLPSSNQVAGSLSYPFSRSGCLSYPSAAAAAAAAVSSPYGYSLTNPSDQLLYTSTRQSPYPSTSLPNYLPNPTSLQDNQLLYRNAEAAAVGSEQASYSSSQTGNQQVSPYAAGATASAQMQQSSYTSSYQSESSSYPSSASPYSYQQQEQSSSRQQAATNSNSSYRSYSPGYTAGKDALYSQEKTFEQQQQQQQQTSSQPASLYSGTPPPTSSYYSYFNASDSLNSGASPYSMQQ